MRTLFLTSPLMQGPDVLGAQHRLHSNPYADFSPGGFDGDFGPHTAAACVRAKHFLGYPQREVLPTYGLVLDGLLSGRNKLPATYRARQAARLLAEKNRSQKALALVSTAVAEIGTKEYPAHSNRVKYSIWYGGIGPWCAEFISWCSAQVGVKFRYAYCPYVVQDAEAHRNGLSTVLNPATGVLALFDWAGESKGVADHIGLCVSQTDLQLHWPHLFTQSVERWGHIGPGDFWSIEGNTSPNNDSNGGEVWLRKRNRSSVQAFVKIAF